MKLIITQKLKDEIVSWIDLNDIKEFAQKNPHLVQAEENNFNVIGVFISVPIEKVNYFDFIQIWKKEENIK